MKKACTVWHWPELEGSPTVRIIAILLRFNREVAHDLGGLERKDFRNQRPENRSKPDREGNDVDSQAKKESVNFRGQTVVACSDERADTMFYLPAPGGA